MDSVKAFNAGERTFEKLPILRVELYLTGNFDYTVNGKNNTDARKCDGIRLVCEPNRDYISEITEALEAHKLNELVPSTRNKLYVALSRARGNVYLINEETIK